LPATAAELVDLLELEQIDTNLFRGRQPDTVMQRVFGGQVAAQAVRAASHTVPDVYELHSLHSYFLRPGDPAVPIVYDVEELREGRTFATRRVVARQHGHGIFFMTANYQKPEEGFEHQDLMPEVLAPEDGVDLAAIFRAQEGPGGVWEREWTALDVRFVGDSHLGGVPDDPTRPARAQLWIRVAGEVDAEPAVHQAAFTYASDLTLLGAALVPQGLRISSTGIAAASLDHTIWFHRPFRADEWWLYDQHAPSASGGRGLALARVWTQDGRLVATVAQEGLIRYSPPS